jgi:phosphonate transport system substrate-binding protein
LKEADFKRRRPPANRFRLEEEPQADHDRNCVAVDLLRVCADRKDQSRMLHSKKIGGWWMAALLLSSAACNAQVRHAAPVTLSFGVVPQQSTTRTVHLWSGLVEEVGRRSGYRIELKPTQDIPKFEQRLAAGEFDLVYMNPYEYTMYHRAPGYQAFAREEGQLEALIVVRRDSAIQKISDLQGSTLALVPAAFAATALPLAYLRQQGITVRPNFVSSHESVYLSIIEGTYSAGGGVRRTFERIRPDMRTQLRVLWAAAPVTPHAITAHPRVPRVVVEQLQRVLLDLKRDAAGRNVLKELGFTGIIAAHDQDWDDVRALRLDPDPVPGQTRPLGLK